MLLCLCLEITLDCFLNRRFLFDYFSPFGLKQQQSIKYSDTEAFLFGGNSQKSYATSNVYRLTENQVSFL